MANWRRHYIYNYVYIYAQLYVVSCVLAMVYVKHASYLQA